ncbi:tRNA uridine-5-carboxymethylaminomethyl(34) synthesis GTPase MnmE [Solemya velesiana gill symbiont]|uniref:tRNA modification GTPase MnmE n=1 Tax=Solemya velesiana gill symbiont TaxID=1918948 RepID=A0A1T2KXW0_9GAMM|nr:tRNA uridine-5-carboxymethylaminomethyl(34) synthesis GTPase MnmE [Solemya velesiana gill symbiont]OOZ37556.1 tRNA uridine-5-carboxymethylaminomethyl(34) synthesis GTPase MnmE [Solemya velesiana gill symbiont]
MNTQDTIAAIATPPGMGGVGIIRISGKLVPSIAEQIIGRLPDPRLASFARFRDAVGEPLDEGVVLYFSAPNSFTGEEVLEFQGHGGPVVMDLLLKRVLECGARLAHPGEFSQRAFLNDKLDLAQAEAIADLIESGTAAAARLAVRSLEGEFSRRIHGLVEQVTHLRMYVEAAIDFPEEEIDFLAEGKVSADLQEILDSLESVEKSAQVGRLLRDGMTLVIAGRPNAGKSSLLNALAGRESAIVTEIPGTTRDLLRERIQIDGMPLHLVDTAGLRESSDRVEQEGIRRARQEIEQADLVLWIFDDQADPGHDALDRSTLPEGIPVTLVRNKIDVTGSVAGLTDIDGETEIALSARTEEGVELLRDHLKQRMGYHGSQEGEFIARRRHLDALARAKQQLLKGKAALEDTGSGELMAEDLRLAQHALSEITGEFTADDLLGRIFSSFCIGK